MFGNSDAFIKDSSHFVQFVKDCKTEQGDILVSFDVVSLFTKVPIHDSILIIKNKLGDEIVDLVEFFLRSTFFSFQNVIYEQVEGVAMGLSLSLLS